MPSVYDYRHIELDRVGTGKKRIIKPPGGEASDIFGRKLPASPNGSIVSTSPPSSPGSSSAASSAPSTPRRGSLRMEDTKNRLFGPAVTPSRKIKDHMKSSIFSSEDTADSPTPSLTPSKQRCKCIPLSPHYLPRHHLPLDPASISSSLRPATFNYFFVLITLLTSYQ